MMCKAGVEQPEIARQPPWIGWLGASAVGILGALFVVNLYVQSTIFLVSGDVAEAIATNRDESTFLSVQQKVDYDWWLLAQMWIMKLLGVLSLQTAKLTSVIWAAIGLLALIWTVRVVLRCGWIATVVATVFYINSAQVLTWGRFGFDRYAASIALGGLTLAASLQLYRRRLQPSAGLIAYITIVFATSCLFAPPAAFLIASGLGIAWVASLPGTTISGASRRLLLCVLMGLPAAIICVPAIFLYPLSALGNPPDYARHLLLPLGSQWEEAGKFLVLQSGMLIDSVFDPTHGGIWLWSVLGGALVLCGAIIPWLRPRQHTQRLVAPIIVVSLAPAAILSLLYWYPYGSVRYEYYACIPLFALAGLGTGQLVRLASDRLMNRRYWTTAVGVLIVTGWSTAVYGQVARIQVARSQAAAINDGYAKVEQWFMTNPTCPVIVDCYTSAWLRMADIEPINTIFTISRNTVRHNKTTSAETDQFKIAIMNQTRVATITWQKFDPNRYTPYVELLEDEGFTKEQTFAGRWRLVVWHHGGDGS